MFRSVFILVLLCAGLLVGCNSRTWDDESVVNGIANVVIHSNYSQDVSYKELPLHVQGMGGYGIGFARVEERDLDPQDRTNSQEFRLEDDESFKLLLLLGNGTQQPRTCLVTIILDYRQIRFELDGKTGLLHEITVPPEVDMELPFQIDVDGKGAHDIQVVAFDYPYDLTFDNDFRMDLHGHVISRRSVIIVGEDETPARSVQPTIAGVPIPQDIKFTPRVGFATAELPDGSHPSHRQLYVGEAVAGDKYQFQIYSSNPDENEALLQAMILFLDYHQVEINDLGMIIADFKPEQEAIVDVELVLQEDPGIHQLQVIYVFDPYQSVLRYEVYAPFVFGSPRIAIDVR